VKVIKRTKNNIGSNIINRLVEYCNIIGILLTLVIKQTLTKTNFPTHHTQNADRNKYLKGFLFIISTVNKYFTKYFIVNVGAVKQHPHIFSF
jgi:hypothetical protein